jgi:hypothetical protein
LPLASAGGKSGFWLLSAGYFTLLLLLALYRSGSPPAGRPTSGNPPKEGVRVQGLSDADRE